jgi:hypothetical protein
LKPKSSVEYLFARSHAMSEDDISTQTKDAYLRLIHPARQGGTYHQEIASVIALAPSDPDKLVAAMIAGAAWRERLLGPCMAMAKQPAIFIEAMLQSLRDPPWYLDCLGVRRPRSARSTRRL